MEVNIYFKPMKTCESYEFSEEEFKRFEEDYLKHAESKIGKPQSGSYTCQQYNSMSGSPMAARTLLIRFDEIVLK